MRKSTSAVSRFVSSHFFQKIAWFAAGLCWESNDRVLITMRSLMSLALMFLSSLLWDGSCATSKNSLRRKRSNHLTLEDLQGFLSNDRELLMKQDADNIYYELGTSGKHMSFKTSSPTHQKPSAPSHKPPQGKTSAPTHAPVPRTSAPTSHHRPEGTKSPTLAPSRITTGKPSLRPVSPTKAPSRSPVIPIIPTISPTRTPPTSGTNVPTNLPCAGLSRNEAMLSILSQVTPESRLLNEATAQGRAYAWILDDDPAQVDPCTYPTIQQRYSLATFYFATGGPDSWVSSEGWLSQEQECRWQGVSCDRETNAVISLVLRGNGLSGEIPPEIQVLRSMQGLYFPDNDIRGVFPLGMVNMGDLTEIDVERNNMSGNPFAVLTALQSLRRLRLSWNNFSGPLPSTLSNLEMLREFWLVGNTFTGTLPVSVSRMFALESFLLGDNQFSGTLPSQIGSNLLLALQAQNNQFVGSIPDGLWLNTNLIVLRLDNNSFSGQLSSQIGSLASLQDLRLSRNRFTGTLPPELWNLNNLESILASNNDFAGPLRDSFGSFARLDFVDFSGNDFTGTLPASLFDIPNLRILYLTNNRFEGPIPSNYGNPPLLRDLYLSNNTLTGQIPPIGENQLQELTELLLDDNRLTGTMPESICALREPAGILEDLWADCRRNPQTGEIEVICQCCTQCSFSEVSEGAAVQEDEPRLSDIPYEEAVGIITNTTDPTGTETQDSGNDSTTSEAISSEITASEESQSGHPVDTVPDEYKAPGWHRFKNKAASNGGAHE